MIPDFPYSDRAQYPIAQVQWNLGELSRIDPRIPHVKVDGIYGQETADAVRAFQEAYGLPPTGEVDLTTWNALKNAYEANYHKLAPAVLMRVWTEDFHEGVIKKGDRFDAVYIIQIILNAFGSQYNTIGAHPITGYFGDETERAVMEFQKRNGLIPNGIVDKRTWNRLADAYNAHRYNNE